LKHLLLSKVSAEKLVAVVLVALVSGISADIYFSIPQQNSQPQPEETPIATQNPTTQPLTTPTTPEISTNPAPAESSEPEKNAPGRGLLDDLSDSEKTQYQTVVHAALGNWSTFYEFYPKTWQPNATVRFGALLNFSDQIYQNYLAAYSKINFTWCLLTLERDFDPAGNQHSPWDESMSTILTPAGLPIEGGGSVTVSSYTGYTQKTPVDTMVEVPIASFPLDVNSQTHQGKFLATFNLPSNLPPGIYRLKLDFGFRTTNTRYNFNGDGISTRPKDLNNISCTFSPPIPTSGYDVTGKWVDSSQINRHSYWVLLWDYYSNGYRGVVANEDQKKVAISPRNIMHDTIVLPKISSSGTAISYNIEPTFLMNNINLQRNVPLSYTKGTWTVKITLPNGTVSNLGTANFVASRGNGATTKNTSFTAWKPPVYGNYSIEAYGYVEDIWGNRYYGGGNYTFWIAQRLTLATATFQGQPYNVGNRYGRDMAFNPPVPANVTVKATLYINSDTNNTVTMISMGQASVGGIFGAAQGLKALTLNYPGEYYATVFATYWDSSGTLWVCAMRHAGVVYPLDSSIEAHGKKLTLQNGTIVNRGEQNWEGYTAPNGTSVLDHINFPYNASDALLIASEYQSSNKIEPVLTYIVKGSNATYSSSLQTIGKSNLIITTSNGYEPEMFPEYITNLQYYYGSAPRPGFNSRFIVSQDGIRAPYWPTSPNSFGGQIGASNNGDMPGDIYRLLGGVVVRNQSQAPLYAGYQASAFILPKGTNNNRVIGPGTEDLPSPDGTPARFFLVPLRPGMVYTVGATFGAVLQIDPIVPCSVSFSLTAPNGTSFTATGSGDQYGYFAAVDKWPLDKAGLWKYTVNATWNGYSGRVPGLPSDGGWIYVLENPPSNQTGLQLNIPASQTFAVTDGLTISGNSTATKVYFAAIIPGAVLEEGTVDVVNGKFNYTFSPQNMAGKIQTYDIINKVNGKSEIGRVVHLTFFTEENGPNGVYHNFARVVLRGTTAIYVKGQ
jgi:hypothetical protein